MTYRIFGYIIALVAISCTNPKNEQSIATPSITDNAELINTIQGDIDGNGTLDNISLYHNIECDSLKTLSEDYLLIINRADSTIFSSKDKLSCLTYEGDLNGDGCDEIGVVSNKHHSSWEEYRVMSYKDGWKELVTTTINLRIAKELDSTFTLDKLIELDSTTSGSIIIKRPVVYNGERIEHIEERIKIL